ncbi:TEX12 protein, partial [Rhinopomastus cyanomelas]|nr:TEX12 protein [Rhinopomastus cyanomelas]
PQLSSLNKPDLAFPEDSQSLYEPEPLEKLLDGDVSNTLKVALQLFQLSESAATDASYIQELDGILKEAKAIENHLKQRRESLKHKLTVIANAL